MVVPPHRPLPSARVRDDIMLVSVTERTREIGVRKAVGARRSDIAWQFLAEAMALTGAGGLVGLMVVEGRVLLIRSATTIQAAVPLWAVAAGLGVSLGVGLVFGVWQGESSAPRSRVMRCAPQ